MTGPASALAPCVPSINGASEALAVLKMLIAQDHDQNDTRAACLRAVSLWIMRRETETDDIKHGAVRLMTQMAREHGRRMRGER